MNTEANQGLTYSAEHKRWMNHQELGAHTYTIPEAFKRMYSGRKFRSAMSLWYVWEWCIEEFLVEWKERRRAF